MCQAYARMGLPPLVRIPAPDPFEATTVLDGGAAGVIAPSRRPSRCAAVRRGEFRPVKGQRLTERLAVAPFEPALEDMCS